MRLHLRSPPESLKTEVGDASKAFTPIVTQRCLSTDDALAVVEQLHSHGRREDDVIREVTHHLLEVVGNPALNSAVDELLCLCAIEGPN
jgi:hypothetical protein